MSTYIKRGEAPYENQAGSLCRPISSMVRVCKTACFVFASGTNAITNSHHRLDQLRQIAQAWLSLLSSFSTDQALTFIASNKHRAGTSHFLKRAFAQ